MAAEFAKPEKRVLPAVERLLVLGVLVFCVQLFVLFLRAEKSRILKFK